MTTTTMSVKLAQEIHDEFLVCKICTDAYKTPKCLDCLHTFCERCIETHVLSEATYKKYSDYRDFTCPLCRKRTRLPVGGVRNLADNFLVMSLSETIGRQRISSGVRPHCDICKLLSGKIRDAACKCLDCAKLLCAACAEQHRQTRVTGGHSLFDVDIEKDIECKEHADEAVRFYCEPCETCICVLCTFHAHKDHVITQFGEAVDKYRVNIERLVRRCREKVEKFDVNSASLVNCEKAFRAAEQQIHDTAISFIQDIRVRERQLVDELRNVYGADCMDHIDQRADLGIRIENLRSTCALTEHILNGTDIELLLLRADVEAKLETLSDVVVEDLPPSVDKVVEFVPGAVDVGYIFDADRPLASAGVAGLVTSTARRPINSSGGIGDHPNVSVTNDVGYVLRQSTTLAANKSVPSSAQTPVGVPAATQTERQADPVTVSRAVQTDIPSPPSPSHLTSLPTRRSSSLYRRPEASSFSKPAKFG